MIKQEHCTLFANTGDMHKTWCVFEHFDEAGEVIYVNVCPLSQVFTPTPYRKNSEWNKIYAVDAPVTIRIIATSSNIAELRRFAVNHVRSLPVMPRCNLHGFEQRAHGRAILCSNGQRYADQKEAAAALGVTVSAVSQAMKRDKPHVRGFTLIYEGETNND